ncbi:MAG: hypothetical protein JNK64_19080 [Myxococcales bacterium]|nr:hypothetical protein [Myxococcales bacterium]
MRGGVLVGAMVVAVTAAAAQPAAPTADDRAAAKAAFALGTRHFNVAEYDDAIAAFKESYKRVPAPLLLYNIAQAYRQKRDCAEAAKFYRSYLREAPAAKDRARVEQRIVEMDACAVAAPPPADRPGAGAPPPTDPAPGATVPATPPGEPGPTLATKLVLPPPPPIDRGRTLRLSGLITAGVGVGALAAGGLLSLRARGLGDDIEAACATGCTAAAVLAADRDGAAAERNATIAYAVGAAAVTAGVALYVVGRRRASERPAVALVPTARGGLAVAAWTWR